MALPIDVCTSFVDFPPALMILPVVKYPAALPISSQVRLLEAWPFESLNSEAQRISVLSSMVPSPSWMLASLSTRYWSGWGDYWNSLGFLARLGSQLLWLCAMSWPSVFTPSHE